MTRDRNRVPFRHTIWIDYLVPFVAGAFALLVVIAMDVFGAPVPVMQIVAMAVMAAGIPPLNWLIDRLGWGWQPWRVP